VNVYPVPFSSFTNITEHDAPPAVVVVIEAAAAVGWFVVKVHGDPAHVPSLAYSIGARAVAEVPDAVMKTKLPNGFVLTGIVIELMTI